MSVAGLLQLVHDCMSAEMLYLFKQDISHNQMPEQSAQQIVSAIMAHARFVCFSIYGIMKLNQALSVQALSVIPQHKVL